MRKIFIAVIEMLMPDSGAWQLFDIKTYTDEKQCTALLNKWKKIMAKDGFSKWRIHKLVSEFGDRTVTIKTEEKTK